MIAVVTGAGSGIGLSCVAKLLIRDYIVIALVKNKLGEERLLSSLALKNIRVHKLYIFSADFENVNQVQEMINECKNVIEGCGNKLDVFINCAGIYSSLNFKANSGNEIHMVINFLTPIKILKELSNYLNNSVNARVVFLFPNLNKNSSCFGKNSNNFKKEFYNSKLCLALYLHELSKKCENYNIYLFMPRPSTTDFYIKNTSGYVSSLGLLRKMFSLPPEYSAEQIIMLATRPEFSNESGALYKELKPVPLPKYMYNKKLIQKFNAYAYQPL